MRNYETEFGNVAILDSGNSAAEFGNEPIADRRLQEQNLYRQQIFGNLFVILIFFQYYLYSFKLKVTEFYPIHAQVISIWKQY